MIGSRNYHAGDPAVTDRPQRFLEDVAAQDNSILEMATDHWGYHRWQAGVEFQADVPAIRARSIVGTMIATERGSLNCR